jgi:hypothetical protein
MPDDAKRRRRGPYAIADVRPHPEHRGKDGSGGPVGVGQAGEARRAAEAAPNDDRDRWQGFSARDAEQLAAEPAKARPTGRIRGNG